MFISTSFYIEFNFLSNLKSLQHQNHPLKKSPHPNHQVTPCPRGLPCVPVLSVTNIVFIALQILEKMNRSWSNVYASFDLTDMGIS